MRALLLIAAIALAMIPAVSNAASRHGTVERSHHVSPRHRRPRRSSRLHHRRRSRRRRTSAPRYQLHPTVARYKQIQQALKDKGYYHGEIDGKWGPESVSALQRFQTEQGIENEGKITALGLIGLGLGPKHAHAIAMPPANDTLADRADERED